MRVTAELLREGVGCAAAVAERWAPHLDRACQAYGITTRERLAAFLAQIGHESGSLVYVREIWGPTPAQQRYEGRRDLGNTERGDGERYKGRGLIQLTGRFNYRQMTGLLRDKLGAAPDFESSPALLETPEWAAMSAAAFWDSRKLNALADAGDFHAITQRINGGQNGAVDRLKRWDKAKAIIALIADRDAAEAQPARQEEPAPQEELAIDQAPVTQDQSAQFSAWTNNAESGEPMAAPIIPAVGKLLLQAALPTLLEKVPLLQKVPEPVRMAAAEVAVTAVSGGNVQDALEKIAADPAVADKARGAVADQFGHLIEVGGGIAAARQASGTGPVWATGAFLVTVLLMPLIYMTVGAVLFNDGWSTEIRAAVVAAVVSGALAALTGFWLGSSFSSQRKDERRA